MNLCAYDNLFICTSVFVSVRLCVLKCTFNEGMYVWLLYVYVCI